MSFGTTVADALRTAGFNVTDVYQYEFRSVDIEIGEESLTFGLQHDGTVTWHDFTHTTVIAPIDKPDELVAAFTELLPLRDEALQEWIASRKWETQEQHPLGQHNTPY